MSDVSYTQAKQIREGENRRPYSTDEVGSQGIVQQTEFLLDTSSDRIPNPLRFGDEAFTAFAVRGGRIYRLRYDVKEQRVGSSPGVKAQSWPVVEVSRLNDRYEGVDYFSMGSFSQTRFDGGILISGDYLYFISQATPNSVRQVHLGSHGVRSVDVSQFVQKRGLIYNFDDGKVYYLGDTAAQPVREQGLLGFSEVRGEEIWELDERDLTFTKLTSQGGGDIRLVQEILVNSSGQGSLPDWRWVWWQNTAYVWEGKLYAPITIADREGTMPLEPNNPWRFLGVAVWEWDEQLRIAQENGTRQAQWMEPEILPPGLPNLDVGRSIRFPYGIEWNYADWGNLGGMLGFACDEQGVAWVQYFENNFVPPDDSPQNRFFGNGLHTQLIRYNLATGQEAVPITIEWDRDEYFFEYTEGQVPHSAFYLIGTCRATSRLRGVYSIENFGRLSEDISPYWTINQQGQIRINPERQFALEPGEDRLVVRYTLPTGEFSERDVIIRVYAATDTEAVAPVWVGQPYTATIPLFTNTRFVVAQVRAEGADRYRLGVSVSNRWGIDSITGEIFWAGTEPVPEFPPSYALEVVAENDGTQFQTTSTSSAVVSVSVGERADYVAPSWQSEWVPVGFELHPDGHLSNIDDYTDDDPVGVDFGLGAIEGSVPRERWQWRIDEENPDIANAVLVENSSRISFVGAASGSAGFVVSVFDGVATTRLTRLVLTWELPDTEASFISFFHRTADGTAIPAAGLSQLDFMVEEGSGFVEVATGSGQGGEVWVVATPQAPVGVHSRFSEVVVSEGGDIVSAVLGERGTISIGGTANNAQRLHIYLTGENLDFEERNLARAKIRVVAPAITLNDRDYRAVAETLTLRIDVTDSETETDTTEYRAPAIDVSWEPDFELGDFVLRDNHWWVLADDIDAGIAGSAALSLAGAIIKGTEDIVWSWGVNQTTPPATASVETADLVSAAINDQGVFAFRGDQAADNVFVRVWVSDSRLTIPVATFQVSYEDNRIDSGLVLWQDDSEVSAITATATEGGDFVEADGGDFFVEVEQIEYRPVNITTDDPLVMEAVLPVDVAPWTIDGEERLVRLLIFWANPKIRSQGTYTGYLGIWVDEDWIGDDVYTGELLEIPWTITIETSLVSPNVRFWRKHRTTMAAEVISQLDMVVLQGTTAFRFPVGSDSQEWSDYDYYFTSDALGEQPYTFNVVLASDGSDTPAVEVETGFVSDVVLGDETLDAERLTFIARTDTHPTFFEFPSLTDLTLRVSGVETRADSDRHSWAATTAELAVSGDVFFDSDIRVYNENIREQIYRLDMVPLLEGSSSQEWHTLLGGQTFIWAEQITNRTLTASLLNEVEGLSVSLSSGLQNVAVLAEGGGQETLPMKTLTLTLDASNLEDGVVLGVVSIVAEEYTDGTTTWPEEEHRLAVRGELVASQNTTPTTFEVRNPSGTELSSLVLPDIAPGITSPADRYNIVVCYPGAQVRQMEITQTEAVAGVSFEIRDDIGVLNPSWTTAPCRAFEIVIDRQAFTAFGEQTTSFEIDVEAETAGGVVYDAGSFTLPLSFNVVADTATPIAIYTISGDTLTSFSFGELTIDTGTHRRNIAVCYPGAIVRTFDVSLASAVEGVSLERRDDIGARNFFFETNPCRVFEIAIDTDAVSSIGEASGTIEIDVVAQILTASDLSVGYEAGTATLPISFNVVPASTLATDITLYYHTTAQAVPMLAFQEVAAGEAEILWTRDAIHSADAVGFPGITQRTATASLVDDVAGIRVVLEPVLDVASTTRRLRVYIDTTDLEAGEVSGTIRIDVPAAIVGSVSYEAGQLDIPFSGMVAGAAYVAPSLVADWVPTLYYPYASETWTRAGDTITTSLIRDSYPRSADWSGAVTAGTTPITELDWEVEGGGLPARVWYRKESPVFSVLTERDGNTTFNVSVEDSTSPVDGPSLLVRSDDNLRDTGVTFAERIDGTLAIAGTTAISVDRGQHRQQILTSGTDDLFIRPTRYQSGRGAELIVVEGSEYLTLIVDDAPGEVLSGWQRVKAYVSGAAMDTTDPVVVKILGAAVRYNWTAGGRRYATGAHEYELTLNPTGTQTSEPIYKAPYPNIGWVPEGWAWSDTYPRRQYTITASRADGNLTIDLASNGGALLAGTETAFAYSVFRDLGTTPHLAASVSGNTLTITPPASNETRRLRLKGGDQYFQHTLAFLYITWTD